MVRLYVVYADQVFLENLVVDYLLLMVTARVSGMAARRWRAAGAAALGGLYGALAAAWPGGFLTAWPVKLAVGVLMVLAVFGGSERFLRVCLVFFGASAAFAGAVMAGALARGEDLRGTGLGRVSFGALLLAFALFGGLFSAVFRAAARHRVRGEVTRLTVTYKGRSTVIPALLDTGNGLTEPVSGLPVAVCSLRALEPVLGPEVRAILKSARDAPEALERLTEAGDYTFFLVPYRALGREDGMILAFRPDGLRRGQQEIAGLVGIDPSGVGEGAGYGAIVGM